MLLLFFLLLVSIALVTVAFIKSEEAFFILGCLVGFVFLCFLATVPINRIDTKASIAKFNATAMSLAEARKQGNVLENAAMQQKVIEQNQWLSEAQYYRSSFWWLWVPVDVNKLNPIK